MKIKRIKKTEETFQSGNMKLMAKATVASNIHQKVKKYAKSRKLVLKNYGCSLQAQHRESESEIKIHSWFSKNFLTRLFDNMTRTEI